MALRTATYFSPRSKKGNMNEQQIPDDMLMGVGYVIKNINKKWLEEEAKNNCRSKSRQVDWLLDQARKKPYVNSRKS